MKIPKTFSLAGTVWTVDLESDISEMGNCEGQRAIIRIRADLPQQAKESTFCHELVHAIMWTAGFPFSEQSERDVDAFGNLLHQFLVTSGGK